MKKFIFLLFYFVHFVGMSQEKPVTVKSLAKNNELIFTAVNTASVTQELTLTLTKSKGIKGYDKPIKTTLAPGANKTIATFPLEGAYSYAYNTNYKEAPTTQEIGNRSNALKQHTLKELSQIKEGIVVFDKTDCPRCQMSTAYLLDNDIDFKLLNITDNPKNKKLMWDLLKAEGVTNNITTPVFLVNGQLSYSHDNLREFLSGLK